MPRAIIGDWKGSLYDLHGRRTDFHLFLDHDGRYEWNVQRVTGDEIRDAGGWELIEQEATLQLMPDSDETSGAWRILSIERCEGSYIILVLRDAVLARNLPILFYRVHGDGKGYGTEPERRLAAGNQNDDDE